MNRRRATEGVTGEDFKKQDTFSFAKLFERSEFRVVQRSCNDVPYDFNRSCTNNAAKYERDVVCSRLMTFPRRLRMSARCTKFESSPSAEEFASLRIANVSN